MNRSMRVICVLAIFALGTALAIAQETDPAKESKPKGNKNISSKYDKSKDRTTVKLKESNISDLQDARKQVVDIPTHEAYMVADYSFPGTEVKEQVETMFLRFRIVSRAYFFLKGQQIVVALDKDDPEQGRAIDLKFSDYDSDVKFNSVYEEYLNVEIPFTALDKITKAKTIHVYVGQIPYRLNPKQIQDLRDLGAGMIPKNASE